MKKYYAYDLNGRRISNIDGQEVDRLFASHRISWIKRDKSVKVATDENLRSLILDRCGFCGSTKKISCTRGPSRKDKRLISKDQFETVCGGCLLKHKGRTPKSLKRFLQYQRQLATDFELRYPGSMMAAVSDEERSRDFMMAGYVTPSEALRMSEEGLGRIMTLGGKNCVAFSFYGKAHRRGNIKKEVREEMFSEADNRCFFCGERGKEADLTIDHKRALRLMGTNDRENLAVACDRCNQDKGTMEAQEFISYLRRKKPSQVD